ncbi:MAG TPA: MFS transporter, partial [Micromonosporaceae bacterium]
MAFTSSSTVRSNAAISPRWSDLYIAALARAASNCGDMLAATALALILQGRGEGGLAVAGIMLAAALPLMVVGPFAGRLADRVDSRKLLITVGLAQVAVCVALAFTRQPAFIIGLVAVLAIGLAITSPTMSALTPLMVGRDNLAKASGISQTASTIGMLLAPALGGVLVGAFGARVPLLIDAGTYLAIPIAGLLIRTRRGGKFRAAMAANGEPGAVPAPTTFRLRSDGLMWPLFVLIGAVIAAISAVDVVDVFFVRETLHSTPWMYGVVGATWLGGMVIGAVFAGRQRRDDVGTARVLLLFALATSVTIGVAGLVPHVAWLIPLWLIGGVLNAIGNVGIGVILGSRVPPEVRGHAGAIFNSIASGANATGFLLGGALLAVAAPRTLIVGCGLAGLAVTAIFAPPLVRAIRREQTLSVSTN